MVKAQLADAPGGGADVALSMNVVVWNSAIAGGGLLGGVLLDHWGAGAFAWVMLLVLLISLAIAFRARAHGFAQGERAAGERVVAH